MSCPSCGRALEEGVACPACGAPRTRGGATATLAAPARLTTPAARLRARTPLPEAGRRPEAPPGPPPARRDVCTALAIVLGLLAVVVVPIAVGPLAILVAAAANWRGERRAGAGLAVAVAGTLLGLVLGIVTAPAA